MTAPSTARASGSQLEDDGSDIAAAYSGGQPQRGRLRLGRAVRAEPGQEMDKVADAFGLHPLAVEDAVVAHQRPKLERYGDGDLHGAQDDLVRRRGRRRRDRRDRGVRRQQLRRDGPTRRGRRRSASRDTTSRSTPRCSDTGRTRCCTRCATASSTRTRSVAAELENDVDEIELSVFSDIRKQRLAADLHAEARGRGVPAGSRSAARAVDRASRNAR